MPSEKTRRDKNETTETTMSWNVGQKLTFVIKKPEIRLQ